MINNDEKNQGNEYLSKIYSLERRPLSEYPNQLAKHLSETFIKKKQGFVVWR